MNASKVFVNALKDNFWVKTIEFSRYTKMVDHVFCDIDNQFSLIYRSGMKDSYSKLEMLYLHGEFPCKFLSILDFVCGKSSLLVDWSYDVNILIKNCFEDFILKIQKSKILNQADAILAAFVYLENYNQKVVGGSYAKNNKRRGVQVNSTIQ